MSKPPTALPPATLVPSTIEDDIRKIREQEATLVFPHFDAETGWHLGCALRAVALERGAALVIDIRRGEEVVFHHAMAGTTPANADWTRRKRNVVELLRRSSYAVGLEHRLTGQTLEDKLGLPTRDYACHGGGFPLRVAGTGHVGVVSVSGLPQRDDHELVVATIARLLGVDPATLALD